MNMIEDHIRIMLTEGSWNSNDGLMDYSAALMNALEKEKDSYEHIICT